MVRRSFTAVLEKNTTFTSDFSTEPYEAGWAAEARWFIRVLEMEGSETVLRVTPQISPDGLFWCEEGSAPLLISKPGLYSFALREFGHWLRLDARLAGAGAQVKVLIYLALKE
ncbi:MAG: hypothetical protein IT158_15930 [Bryobacterales bacterium]|nr:hypothetical protein [Bryobacterales bacterium]